MPLDPNVDTAVSAAALASVDLSFIRSEKFSPDDDEKMFPWCAVSLESPSGDDDSAASRVVSFEPPSSDADTPSTSSGNSPRSALGRKVRRSRNRRTAPAAPGMDEGADESTGGRRNRCTTGSSSPRRPRSATDSASYGRLGPPGSPPGRATRGYGQAWGPQHARSTWQYGLRQYGAGRGVENGGAWSRGYGQGFCLPYGATRGVEKPGQPEGSYSPTFNVFGNRSPLEDLQRAMSNSRDTLQVQNMQESGLARVAQGCPKQCHRCCSHYSGFGSVCSHCRRSGSGGEVISCTQCQSFFRGFGSMCDDCADSSSRT